MKALSRRLLFGSIAALALIPVVQVVASSQTALKVRIIAPECTIDTIDDGSGPIQIITCPPGVIDPKPPTNNNGGDDDNDDGEDIDVQPTTNPQVSQRLQPTVRPRALVDSLRDSGIAVEKPQNNNKLHETDIIALPKTGGPAPIVQGVLVAAVVLAGAVAIPSKNARLTRIRNSLFRRK